MGSHYCDYNCRDTGCPAPLKESSVRDNTNEELVLPDVKYDLAYKLIGIPVAVCTVGMYALYGFGVFFLHEEWIRRKALLKWLENNELPEPYISGDCSTWEISGYGLVLESRPRMCYVIKNGEIILSSFRSGIIDNKRYNRTVEILTAQN